MFSLISLTIAFISGGITFLILAVAVVLVLLFYTSPIVTTKISYDESRNSNLSSSSSSTTKTQTQSQEEVPLVVFRAGWLTARRNYELSPGDSNITYVGQVYKSLMNNRSRESNNVKSDDYFAVLKQNTLFLYDNEQQLNCRFCFELTSYSVAIYPLHCKDSELFLKRNAITLTLKNLKENENEKEVMESSSSTMDPSSSQPWYLFTKVNSDKEDWYLSLVQASKLQSLNVLAKDRLVFDPDDMAKLILEGIDRQPDAISMRWLNAILGRVFLSLYKTEMLKNLITSRIVKKLNKVNIPSILSDVQVKEVNVGTSIPIFSKPMLKTLTPEGDTSGEIHLCYDGEFRVTIEAVATINLGSRFKPYSVQLVLAVVLQEIEGTLLFKIKKAPTNRIWVGFTSMPRMVLRIEPVVSTRQIKWSLITRPIESRIREVVMESIVLPHMDDIPFFDSEGFIHQGGIFGDSLAVTALPLFGTESQRNVETGTEEPEQSINLIPEDSRLLKRRPQHTTTTPTSSEELSETVEDSSVPRIFVAPKGNQILPTTSLVSARAKNNSKSTIENERKSSDVGTPLLSSLKPLVSSRIAPVATSRNSNDGKYTETSSEYSSHPPSTLQSSPLANTSSTVTQLVSKPTLLYSWGKKAIDKQILSAGVIQAKDTMKRWSTNWTNPELVPGHSDLVDSNVGSSNPSTIIQESPTLLKTSIRNSSSSFNSSSISNSSSNFNSPTTNSTTQQQSDTNPPSNQSSQSDSQLTIISSTSSESPPKLTKINSPPLNNSATISPFSHHSNPLSNLSLSIHNSARQESEVDLSSLSQIPPFSTGTVCSRAEATSTKQMG